MIDDGYIYCEWSSLATELGHINFTMPDGNIQRLEARVSGTGIEHPLFGIGIQPIESKHDWIFTTKIRLIQPVLG